MRKLFTRRRRKNAILFYLFTLTLFGFFIIACNKNSNKELEEPEIAAKKNSAGKNPGPCPYPCDDPRCLTYQEPNPDCGGGGGGGGSPEPDPHAMTVLFSNIDHIQLQQLLNANDSAAIETFFYPLANQIADHILAKYGEDIRHEIGDFPQATVMLGLFEYGIENNISLDSVESMMNRAPIDPYNCFTSALSGLIGIGAIRELYNDFTHGVSPRTILRTLKTFGRRVFTAIGIGLAILDLGDCLDWW